MKNRDNRPSKRIYHYILFSILVSLSLSVFLSAFFITNHYQNIYLERIKESESDRLIQASSTSNFMTEYAMNLALQIYFNPSFSKALFFEEDERYDIGSVIAQLNHIRLSTSFIDSIYLYNHLKKEYIISSSRTGSTIQGKDELSDHFIDRIMNDASFHRENSIYNGKALFLPRELELDPKDPEKKKTVYSLIYKNAFNSSDLSAVVINISSQWFEDILFKNINPLTDREITDVFAIDNRNRVVIKNRHYQFMEKVGQEEWFKRIGESDKPSGYLIEQIENETKLINYYKSRNLQIDWMFVSIKSYSALIKEITDLRRIIIIFSLLLLLATILIEIIVSNRLYRPINTLLNTLETSQVGRDDYRVTLKNNFFRIYLQQKIPLSKKELTEEMERFQIRLDITQSLMMILLRIDNYSQISENKSFKSLSMLKSRILNDISHAVEKQNPLHEVILLQGKYMLLLCNLPADITAAESEEMTVKGIDRIRPEIEEKYGVCYSLFSSGREDDLEKMPLLYEQVLNAARKTMYSGTSRTLSLTEFHSQEKTKFEYPADDVGKIMNGLKKGDDFNKIMTIYTGIIEKAGHHSHRALNYCITRLLLETNDLVYSLKAFNKLQIDFEIEGILDNLEALEDFNPLNDQFASVFQEIINHQSKVVKRNEELIEKISQIVEENYSNPLFSIADIGEKLNLTPAYLGKLYKKSTLHSLNDYITRVRIDKSMQLLRNSDKTINEIARSTGFSTGNYFHIVFKKKVGLTPQKFRNSQSER